MIYTVPERDASPILLYVCLTAKKAARRVIAFVWPTHAHCHRKLELCGDLCQSRSRWLLRASLEWRELPAPGACVTRRTHTAARGARRLSPGMLRLRAAAVARCSRSAAMLCGSRGLALGARRRAAPRAAAADTVTLAAPSCAETEAKKSKFVATAAPVRCAASATRGKAHGHLCPRKRALCGSLRVDAVALCHQCLARTVSSPSGWKGAGTRRQGEGQPRLCQVLRIAPLARSDGALFPRLLSLTVAPQRRRRCSPLRPTPRRATTATRGA